MAIKRIIPLNQISGVAAAATAFINLPTGKRKYHNIYLGIKLGNTGGATEANMATYVPEMRLNFDGTTQRKCSAQELFDMNRIKGKTPTVASGTTTPGWLTFMFAEPQRRGIVEREATAWGTLGVGSFQIEVDIATGATTPTLYGFAEVEDVAEAPMGIVKWKSETIQVSATGELTYKLDVEKGDAYQSLTFIEGTAGDVGAIEILWDGIQLYKDDENFATELLNVSDFTKVSKYRHVPLAKNILAGSVPTRYFDKGGKVVGKVSEFVAKLTMDQAANVKLIREVVGSPD